MRFVMFLALMWEAPIVEASPPPIAPPIQAERPPIAPPIQPELSTEPIREYWGGNWGWMEKLPDGTYRQVAAGGAATPRPFPESTMGTNALRATGASTSFPGSTGTGRIITLAPHVVQLGDINNCPPSG